MSINPILIYKLKAIATKKVPTGMELGAYIHQRAYIGMFTATLLMIAKIWK